MDRGFRVRAAHGDLVLTDLYQRAYTDLYPSADCLGCGRRLVEKRMRRAVPGEWAYRYGVWIIQRYNAADGSPHFCSREDRARALERNQQEALRVSEIPEGAGRR